MILFIFIEFFLVLVELWVVNLIFMELDEYLCKFNVNLGLIFLLEFMLLILMKIFCEFFELVFCEWRMEEKFVLYLDVIRNIL